MTKASDAFTVVQPGRTIERNPAPSIGSEGARAPIRSAFDIVEEGESPVEGSRSIFSHRSLRNRLIVAVLAIDCLAALLTGAVIVWKAQTATKLEIQSAMKVAETLVSDTIRLLQDAPSPVLLQSLDLSFQSVRHVDIEVEDAAGRKVISNISDEVRSREEAVAAAPDWFADLISPVVDAKVFPIIVRHECIGTVTVNAKPSDEINEAWTYAHALLITALCLNIVVLIGLFILFGRVLAPLTDLVAGLEKLGTQDYAVRLPRPHLDELAIIVDHFNKTARALSASETANRRLNLQILSAQDDERRRTALELHDEVGPCLFALDANATSIVTITERLPNAEQVHERAIDVVRLIERAKSINRRVLTRLRPMALGRIPLRDCLTKLPVELYTEDGPIIEETISELDETYGRVVDLTIYRCVQEGLFNAVRHARAKRISLAVDERNVGDRQCIAVCIDDDGVGVDKPLVKGVGLSGMQERVEALNGMFLFETSPRGTRLSVIIPLDLESLRIERAETERAFT